MVGNILTAFFAQASVAGFDGSEEIPKGWIDHHWVQLGYQIADSAAGFGYSFVVTVRQFIQLQSLYSLIHTKLDHHPLDHALHPWSPPPCF